MPPSFQATGLLVATALLASCAGSGTRGGQRAAVDNLAVGTDAGGDACTLQFRWHDPAASEGIDRAYSLFCTGSTGRAVGIIRVQRKAPDPASDACGDPLPATIPGIGAAEVRRCATPELNGAAVAISFRKGDLTYRGVAQPAVVGPLQTAMVAVARQDETAQASPLAFDPSRIPAYTGATPGNASDVAVTNPAGLLRSGIRRNQLGLYAESSRDLNAAISRLPADTSPSLRTELELEAALADSNTGAFITSKSHFDAAEALMAIPANQSRDRFPVLLKKLQVYEALDELNQRQAAAAVATLDKDPQALIGASAAAGASAANPLFNDRVRRDLNTARSRGSEPSAALANDLGTGEIDTLDIMAGRTKSIALLGMRQPVQAKAAIEQAQARQAALVAANTRGNLAWLTASIERQRARIAAWPEGTPDWPAAIEAAGRAVDALEEASRESGYALGQAVAEARIEQARYLQSAGRPAEAVAAYKSAIEALAASSTPGVANLPGIERYLDLLVAQSKEPSSDAASDFFRAVQVLGKPAIARQTADIQSIVTEDPVVAAKVRRRLEGLNEARRLSNVITDAEGGGKLPEGLTLDQLRDQRAAVEKSNDALTNELQASNKFRAVDDSPVALAELRDKVLQPGEVYFKLTAFPRGASYGIAISRAATRIYKVERPTAELMAIGREVRASIDNDAPFAVRAASVLFTQIAGDAAPMLTATTTRRIIVDPSGPLETLPLSVLVSDPASVGWYLDHRKIDRNDFTQVAFVAKQAEVSTALGARSFMITRSFQPITDGRAFLGIGHHQPPGAALEAERLKKVAGACVAGNNAYAQIWNLTPISDRELGEAATALGETDPNPIVGAAFTDTGVLADKRVGEARVIHFATHGLPEYDLGCADVPPSLVTSLGPDDSSDGLLSFDEVARLRLRANLVVLSACDTSSGISERTSRLSGTEGGATLTGLVRGFLAAEARAVLATYWKIPATEESERLIAAFYTSGRTHGIGAALRDAQLTLIREPRYSHPYHWGAFFLVGDGSKSMLGNPVTVENDRAPRTQVATR